MAVYTELTSLDADRIARAHGLGAALRVEGVLAGSVNSNFFVETEARRVFVRIYEEQEEEGVRYELRLLSHLSRASIPVPRCVPGPALSVNDKPVRVFEVLGGSEVCQRMVDAKRAHAVGEVLARAHAATSSFTERRAGRFTRSDVRKRISYVATLERPELTDALSTLDRTLDEVDAAWDDALPGGVIHGDLFRDNLRWDEGRIVGILDWESASNGLYGYDLAVTILAWCFDERMRWDLARALVDGYRSSRELLPVERSFLRTALLAAAARFTTTRITDYHLREGSAQVKKDWRRFFARLSAVAALDSHEIERRLTGG